MTGSTERYRVGWFAIITRPRSHLLTTVTAFVAFIGSIWAGNTFTEYRIWFFALAAVVIMTWYWTMMRCYTKARRQQKRTS